MNQNLETTNLLLGIMAAVSVLEAVMLIGLGVLAWRLYSRVTTLTETVEADYVRPVMAKVNSLVDDVQGLATTVRADRERVERAIRQTVDRVDDTAHRLKADVRARTSWIVGTIRGIRVALRDVLQSVERHEEASVNNTASTRTH